MLHTDPKFKTQDQIRNPKSESCTGLAPTDGNVTQVLVARLHLRSYNRTMQQDDTGNYTVVITERQKQMMAKALAYYLYKHLNSTKIPAEDLDAMTDLAVHFCGMCTPLKSDTLNDLTRQD